MPKFRVVYEHPITGVGAEIVRREWIVEADSRREAFERVEKALKLPSCLWAESAADDAVVSPTIEF